MSVLHSAKSFCAIISLAVFFGLLGFAYSFFGLLDKNIQPHTKQDQRLTIMIKEVHFFIFFSLVSFSAFLSTHTQKDFRCLVTVYEYKL